MDLFVRHVSRGVMGMLVSVVFISSGILGLAVSGGCGDSTSQTLDNALTLYYENNLDEAFPIFEQLAREQPDNAAVHAWLAETYRRMGQKDKAIEAAEKALMTDACNAFALTVIADAVNPLVGEWEMANAERTWRSLNEAVRCDSSDGNAWLGLWGEALHRGDVVTMRVAEQKLIDIGFFTDAILAYSRWTLRGLPQGAILITNGDMDTYPTYAIQKVEGVRPDVVIVNRGLLTQDWYARYLRDHEGLSLPLGDVALEEFIAKKNAQGNIVTLSDEIFARWIDQAKAGTLSRPIAIGATVAGSYYANEREHFGNAGAFLFWSPATNPTPDFAAMQKGLAGVRPEDFAGPWASEQDRSPIRTMYTRDIVRNVTATALTLSESFVKEGKMDRARTLVDWAAKLESISEASPAFAERIAALREDVGG